jgi:hypothetical protein
MTANRLAARSGTVPPRYPSRSGRRTPVFGVLAPQVEQHDVAAAEGRAAVHWASSAGSPRSRRSRNGVLAHADAVGIEIGQDPEPHCVLVHAGAVVDGVREPVQRRLRDLRQQRRRGAVRRSCSGVQHE